MCSLMVSPCGWSHMEASCTAVLAAWSLKTVLATTAGRWSPRTPEHMSRLPFCGKHSRAGVDLQQGSGLAQGLIRLQVLSHAGCHPADWRASALQRLRGCVVRAPSAVQAAGPCMLQPPQGSWPLRLSAAHPCMTVKMRACIGNLHSWRLHALSLGMALATPINGLRHQCMLLLGIN